MTRKEVICDFCKEQITDSFYHLTYQTKPIPIELTYVDGTFDHYFNNGYDICKNCFQKIERKV